MNESKWRIRGNVYLQDSIKEWRQLKEQLAISYYPMRNHKPLKKTTLSSNLHKYYHMNANCFTNKASSAEYSTFLLHHVQALQYCSAVTIQDYIWWINWQRYETFPVCGCRNESICCFSLSFIRWSEYFGVLDMINFTASHWAPGNCDRQSVLNFSLQKPWGFFFLLLHSKKKKKKSNVCNSEFFFSCVKPGEKKRILHENFIFHKKKCSVWDICFTCCFSEMIFFFDWSVSFCNAHFGHKRQKCTTALPLVSQVDCCVLSAFSLMCVNSEQWITATERKAKKVHISGTENGLYVSEMEVGEHVVILPFHQHYAWVPPQYFYVYSDHTDCFMCPNCAWQSAVTISLGHH